jgi:hypothetical protein
MSRPIMRFRHVLIGGLLLFSLATWSAMNPIARNAVVVQSVLWRRQHRSKQTPRRPYAISREAVVPDHPASCRYDVRHDGTYGFLKWTKGQARLMLRRHRGCDARLCISYSGPDARFW